MSEEDVLVVTCPVCGKVTEKYFYLFRSEMSAMPQRFDGICRPWCCSWH